MKAESVGPASQARLGPAYTRALPASLVSDLRSGRAGETGAVMIYRGTLATTATRPRGILRKGTSPPKRHIPPRSSS